VPSAIIGNFVAPSHAEPSPQALGDLVTIGNLEIAKNHRFLLTVLAEAKRAGRSLSLDIFGEGPCRGDLLKQARSLGLEEQVRFHGFRPDVRDLLPTIRVPTLVVHLRDNNLTSPAGRYVAQHVPGAQFVEVAGSDDYWWAADSAGVVLDEVEEFLTGVRAGSSVDRALATLLFTDIVASTQRSSALGDRSWRELLDRHDAAVRRQLVRFRGHEIKTTGDGFLATFDGPARAVECACAIRDAARQLGLDVRSGVHTGEVEIRGEDIGGIAVHIAARVAALAEPGTVWASRTVSDLVVGSGLRFADRGEHELKGVSETWRLYVVET